MTFIDPDTGLLINCSAAEYEQLKPKYIKTKWITGGEE